MVQAFESNILRSLASGRGVALAASILLAANSCSDRSQPTAVQAPTSPNKNIVLTDWYSCWKYVGDTQWRACDYTGTTASENSASWANFTNPTYYTSLQQVAVTQTPSAVEPAPQPYVPVFSDDDTTQGSVIPNCLSNNLVPKDQAWCSGKDPGAATGDHHRLPAINNALAKMRALGPPCDTLANEMAQVVGSHNLRIYHPANDPSSPAWQGGGFASAGDHGNGYVLLADTWVDIFFDEYKYGIVWTVVNGVRTQVKIDLQFGLAHEADHLHNRNAPHLDPKKVNGASTGGLEILTPNAVKCGGLGS
jgi:hypothetical protein